MSSRRRAPSTHFAQPSLSFVFGGGMLLLLACGSETESDGRARGAAGTGGSVAGLNPSGSSGSAGANSLALGGNMGAPSLGLGGSAGASTFPFAGGPSSFGGRAGAPSSFGGSGGSPSLGLGGRAGAPGSGRGGRGGAPSAGGDGSVAPPSVGGGKSVLFFDDFLGTSVDTTKWTVLDRLSDQANEEENCVVAANSQVAGGFFEGHSKHEEHRCGDSLEPPRTLEYTSFQIQQATEPFRYGTIEARAKFPGGTGLWPIIWMLGFEWQASQPATANTPEHEWPEGGWCEIDIAEFWESARSEVNTTVHYNEAGELNLQELPFDATTRFMIYRLEWTQGSLVWSVDAEDGRGYRTLYSVRGANRVPNVPMYIVISAAVGGTGGGEVDPDTFPQVFLIDWVRVTQ